MISILYTFPLNKPAGEQCENKKTHQKRFSKSSAYDFTAII
jgi:hypothetical protein